MKKFNLSRKKTLVGLGVTLAMAVPLSAVAGGPATAAVPTGNQEFTTQIIVKYRNAATASVMDSTTMGTATTAASRRGLGLQHVRKLSQGAQVFRLNNRVTRDEADALAREIQANDPNVEYAEADGRLHALFTPNDTFYATQQWDLLASTAGINMPAAWDKSTGSGVVVAVIDTGYRPHADLAANIVAGYDFISDSAESHDGDGRDSSALDAGDYAAAGDCGTGEPASNSSWHGTHVAGTIAAVTNNSAGIAGIAYGAKVQPVRVLGRCGGSFTDIADAIVWAAGGTVSGVTTNATPAKVINMSLGGTSSCPATLQSAITTARSLGTVVVVAAGNEAANASTSAPANCTGVVVVAATTSSGGRASYSNYGSIVDLAAPGSGIYSTLNAGTTTPGADSYASYSGTSMATPHVAAVAALMLSVNSALTPDEVEARLKSSVKAFPATCSQCGSGLLDASAAIDAAKGTTTTTTAVAETTAGNSTLATAQAITAALPVLITGSVSSTDLSDYYAVTLAAGNTLTATLTPPSSADFDLYIYNASGTLLSSSENGTGTVDTATATNSGTASTTFYVRAYRYSGTGTYTLGLK